MVVKHCLTKQMIADYFTKPIQGKQFYELKKVIMGNSDTLLVKKCVETRAKSNQENVRTNESMVTSNNDEKVKTANDAKRAKKTVTDDVMVSDGTGKPYVRNKPSCKAAEVTIGGKRSTYKISNNFCTIKQK